MQQLLSKVVKPLKYHRIRGIVSIALHVHDQEENGLDVLSITFKQMAQQPKRKNLMTKTERSAKCFSIPNS